MENFIMGIVSVFYWFLIQRKVKLARIEDARKRKATLEKKRLELFKKLEGLATLCNAKVAAIVYGSEADAEPIVFPSHEEVSVAIAKWRHANQPGSRTVKTIDHETYLKNKVAAIKLEIEKIRKKNEEREIEILANRVMNGDVDMNEFNERQRSLVLGFLNRYLEALEKRNEELQIQQGGIVEEGNEVDLDDEFFISEEFMEELWKNELFLEAMNEV